MLFGDVMSRKALLVVIDGCRADVLARALAEPDFLHLPALRALAARSARTLCATTVRPSITLPVHFSIFTSLAPEFHGVLDNTRPLILPANMGLFEWLAAHGRSTGMYANWEFLRELAPPCVITHGAWSASLHCADGDLLVARAAARDMLEHGPDFVFAYLGCLDEVGHRHGFGSPPYLQALERADAALSVLLQALETNGLAQNYAVLLQSDHGGVDCGHEADLPEVRRVPWLLSGPGVRPGELTCPVSVLDTAPTLARLLGVPACPGWQGCAVEQALAPAPVR